MAESAADSERAVRQRELLADLGTAALRGIALDELLQEACRLTADGMGTTFSKVLEYRPMTRDLLVRAGVGWQPGVVGHATLGADDASPAGHALSTGEPVLSNDLTKETRFRTPQLLAAHGVRRTINVLIQGDGKPFGVLEADSPAPGVFLMSDITFLQACANLLGVAIERGRREAELREALDARNLLQREADHRIKNSLQLVASLLSLQRSRLTDPEAIAALDGAIGRVNAIAETHRALHQSADMRTINFGGMLGDIASHIAALRPAIEIRCEADDALELDAERAIPLGLIVSELLTNALLHAYPVTGAGVVLARAQREGEDIVVTIRDYGVGMAAEPAGMRALGEMIIRALCRQIGVEPETHSAPGAGTVVTLRLALVAAISA
ncbi:MAG: GAF domain-containing protein [Acetobacteraceae bacterium]|nr:GAF domain-containing protein [Acetobacteraceae bacterium]